MKKILALVFFSSSFGLVSAQSVFPTNGGNVGIGTLNPAAKISFNNLNDGSDTPDGITWYNGGPLNYGIYRTPGSWLAPAYQQLKLSWDTGIILDPGISYQNSYVDIQRGGLRVSSGNVGIGVSNPASKLDVLGNIKSFNAAFGQTNSNTSTKNYANFSSNNHGTVLMSSNLFFSDNDDQKIANTHPSMSGASIVIPGNGQNDQGGILFYTNTPSSVTEGQAFTGALSMTIKANGDVGIGTGMPREKLSVNGNIRAREIKVEATNWPDYVFEEGYQVGTLEELESYIKVNKHLPEMPSAKEVESNGVDLGDLVKKLLKNQEELTLHIVAQEKKIRILEKQLIKKQKTKFKTKQK